MRKLFCFILVMAMALAFMPAKADAAPATYTLSGTITFSNPVNANTTIYAYPGYAYGFFWNGDAAEIPVKKGATSANFSFSLAPEVYSLEFDGPQEWFYYGAEDKLTDEYNERMYFDLTEKSITGLKINGDALLAGSSSSNVDVQVTINFPKRLTDRKELLIIAGTEDDSWVYSTWHTANAGDRSTTVTLPLNPAKKHFFYYADATEAYTSSESYVGFLYGSEGSVSSIKDNAKLYDISKNSSVTIGYPSSYYTISGTLNRSGYIEGSSASAYVIAEFADGERYADRVVFSKSTTAKSFEIYIPQSQRGKTYTLYTAPANNTNNIGIETSMQKSVSSGTLNRDVNAGTVTMNSDFVTYSGTVSLPAGVKAPAGGAEVSILSSGDDYYDCGTFTIPAGSGSTSFSFNAKSGLPGLRAILTAPVAGSFYETEASIGNRSSISIAFPPEVVISGTVYFPDNTDTAYVGTIRPSTDTGYYDTYFAIRHGEKSTKYFLHIPKGKEIYYLDLYSNFDSSGKFDGYSTYIDSAWQQTSD